MFAANNRADGRAKDTLVNIRLTNEFVVNIADEPLYSLVIGSGLALENIDALGAVLSHGLDD